MLGLQRIRHPRLSPPSFNAPPSFAASRPGKSAAPSPSPSRSRSQRLPLRAFCAPQVPVSCVFPSSSRSSVARAPPASAIPHPRRSPSRLSAGPFRPPRLFPPAVSPQSLAREPAFPAAPSFLTHASRSFCDTLAPQPAPRADPRFLRRSPSCAPSPPTVFPIASLSLPRRYFFFALFTNVEFFIDL